MRQPALVPALLPLLALVAMLSGLFAGPARAEDHGPAIRTVIEQQLTAFRASDLAAAFAFASPTIQRQFGDPQNFGRMVRSGYPMVWRPVRHAMLGLVETSAGPVQVVLFEDAAGRLYEAGYLMQLVDGRWRINGVQLRLRPGAGA